MKLSSRQLATLRTLVDTIFPPEPDGVAGSDLGVVAYIEARLDSAWAEGSSWYNAEPHISPRDPSLGWQSSLRPADVYRLYLDAIDDWTVTHHGVPFDGVGPSVARHLVEQLSSNTFTIGLDIDAARFFQLVMSHVVEGVFRHPHFGGNTDGAGWAWLLGDRSGHDTTRSISRDYAG